MRASDDARAVKGASAGGVERIDGEAGLARTRYAGDAGEGAERDAGGHVLKIVGARIVNGELLARSLAALCGQWDLPRAVQVIGGEAVSVGEHFVKRTLRSEEHTSELQSLMRISYAVFCLKKKISHNTYHNVSVVQ